MNHCEEIQQAIDPIKECYEVNLLMHNQRFGRLEKNALTGKERKQVRKEAANDLATIEDEYKKQLWAVYSKFRFYRMCKGGKLDFKKVREELKHSILFENKATNSKGQTCSVVEEDEKVNSLPVPE